MNHSSGSEKIINCLEGKIYSGELPPGSRLPSLRKIMKDFAVKMGTARSALDYLYEKGLVEKSHGSGTFVKQSARKKEKALNANIAVLSAGDSAWIGVYSSALLGIQKTAEKEGVGLFIRFGYPKMSEKQLASTLKDLSGAIILGGEEHGTAYTKIPNILPLTGICVHETCGGRMSAVDMDPFMAAESAARYFTERKIKKVIIISHEAPNFVMRGRIFSDLWDSSGFRSQTIIYPKPLKYEDKTGYLFTSGGVSEFYCDKYHKESGKDLTDSFPVLSLDGKCRLDPSFHQLPVVFTDWKSIGEAAFYECYSRFINPGTPPKRIYMPVKLIV